MPPIDEIKEEITLFRSLLITTIVIIVSLIGWMAQNETSAKIIIALIAVFVLCIIAIWLFKIITKKIKSLRDL